MALDLWPSILPHTARCRTSNLCYVWTWQMDCLRTFWYPSTFVFRRFNLVLPDQVHFWFADAQNPMTNNHALINADPDLSVHYATFIGLQWLFTIAIDATVEMYARPCVHLDSGVAIVNSTVRCDWLKESLTHLRAQRVFTVQRVLARSALPTDDRLSAE